MRFIRSMLFMLSLPLLAHAQSFSNQQIDQLTAQIALYPDSLLSQVLMAATYPKDVAEAAAWSRQNSNIKGDDAVKMVESQPWDPSVQSLVAFPQVIIMMGEKPEWVRDLGDAFLAQPEDVMDSVQRLRAQAQAAGNLKSNEQVKVVVEPPPAGAPPQQQIIVIQPAQPQTVFVPVYNPTVVFGTWPYPAYPPFYIPPPPGFWFSSAVATGIAWGVGIGVTNALWGGVRWGWGGSQVNINVNRYNNINVNRRLDVNTNNVNWNHNVNNRRDVAYRGGDATRRNLENRAQAGNREQYRGRDDSRARAQQAMQDRGVNANQGSARDRAQSVDRSQLQNRAQGAGAGAGQAQNRAQNVDRSQIENRTQNVDRSQAQQRAQQMNRDNALRGAEDRNARQQIDRGAQSRQAMQQRPQAQQASAGAANRAQAQRPAGGGGGAARPAGGGGGGRPGGGGGGNVRGR